MSEPQIVWAFMLRGHRDEKRNLLAGWAYPIPVKLLEAFGKMAPPAARPATTAEIAKARKKRRLGEDQPVRQLKMEEDTGEGDDGEGESGGEVEGGEESQEATKPEDKKSKKWAQLQGAAKQ